MRSRGSVARLSGPHCKREGRVVAVAMREAGWVVWAATAVRATLAAAMAGEKAVGVVGR